jgi:hypothetical protein
MTEHPIGHPNTEQANTGEPRLAAFASWAVLFASFGLSASTWIALANMAGFTGHLTTPTPFGPIVFALAWLMPIAVDGYVVTALVLWTAPVPPNIAAFARKNTYAAASVGVFAQSAFHSLTILSATDSPWRSIMSALVGALPPGVAALAVHMRALVRREGSRTNTQPITVRRTPAAPVHLPAPTAPKADTAPNTAGPDNRTGRGEQDEANSANVRPITSARRPNTAKATVRPNAAVSGTRAEKIERIKEAFPDWRTNTPSVRDCAKVLGVVASTAHPYQQELVRNAQANTPDAEHGRGEPADDKERLQEATG